MPDTRAAFGGGSFTETLRGLTNLESTVGRIKTAVSDMNKNMAEFRQNLDTSSSGSNPTSASAAMNPSSWGKDAPWGNGPSGFNDGNQGTGFGGFKRMIGGIGLAGAQAIDVEDYLFNDIARTRFGFYSGRGSGDQTGYYRRQTLGSEYFTRMMMRGTPISAMDAAEASKVGTALGFMPGLQNYNTISNSVAGLSNLVPGSGLAASMQGVAALNQGSSVNRLRMIGIQVRGQNGFMRDLQDIARDLWNTISRTATGQGRITPSDLSYSLQPGMSLDMLMDQYFGNDPVLREGIISYLYQFASESKSVRYYTDEGVDELVKTGALTGAQKSIGARNMASYYLQDVNTTQGMNALMLANDQLANMAKSIAGLGVPLAQMRDTFVNMMTYGMVMSGAASGSAGSMVASMVDPKTMISFAAKNPEAAAIIAAIGLAGVTGGATNTNNYLGVLNSGGSPGSLQLANGLINGLGGSGSALFDLLWNGPDKFFNGDSFFNGQNPYNEGGFSGSVRGGGGSGGGAGGGGGVGGNSAPSPRIMKNETTKGWATKLLKRLGAPATESNIAGIQEWMMHENRASSGYLGERNNPLNIKWDPTGKALMRDNLGISIFNTENEGLDATAAFLQADPSALGKGIPNIAKLLKSGAANESLLWSSIIASDWAGGHYGLNSGKVSYNGVTVNINIPGAENMDPAKLAMEIKKVLDEQVAHGDTTGGGNL